MTKRHFIKLAQIMAEARLFCCFAPWSGPGRSLDNMWNYIQRELRELGEAENVNFNAKLFDAACRKEIT